MDRAKPPPDITPEEFFTRWVPEAVSSDENRRRRLADTDATIVFDLRDGSANDPGGRFTLRIEHGVVTGAEGAGADPDLCVRVDMATWRGLNAGDITAPQALLKRRVKLDGDFLLGLKLHLILG